MKFSSSFIEILSAKYQCKRFSLLLLLLFTFFNTVQSEEKDSLLLNKGIELHNKAVQHMYKGNSDSSIYYAKKTISVCGSLGDTTTQIHALNTLAKNQHRSGEFEQAIKNYQNAIDLAILLQDTILLANSIENQSRIYSSTGSANFPKALDLLLQVAQLKEQINANHLLAGTYKSISTIFKELGDTLNRQRYLQKAIRLIESIDSYEITFKAAIYNEAGRYYSEEKPNYEKANEYYAKVLVISEQLNWKKGIAVTLTNQAFVLEKQGRINDAIRLQQKALELKKEMNDKFGVMNSIYSIGTLYAAQNKTQDALQYYTNALALAKENHTLNMQKDILLSLYGLYSKQQKYQMALSAYEDYSALKDSIIGENHKALIEELNTKYETKQKEQKIEQLTTQNQLEVLKANQRKIIAITLALLLVVAFLLFLFIIRHGRLKAQRNESVLNQKLLRTQMNPHFIFNALGSIQNFIYNNEPNEAGKYLSNFSALMRDILESSASERIPLENELQIVNNYLLLLKMRNENSFSYTVNSLMDENSELMVPPMLAQPFIENALIHAFKDMNDKGEIIVTYKTEKSDFIICIEDNGVGINWAGAKVTQHKSMAMQLTRERLQLFDHKRKEVLRIVDKKTYGSAGTLVEIRISLDKCLKF